jgi:hypothetical protein
LRVYHYPSHEIIDAVRLTTAQIKEFLDRTPFKQDIEDKFRGVEGSGVSDEDMFHPPEGIWIKPPTEDELKEHQRLLKEWKEKQKEEKRDPNPVCGGQQSNYNLDSI